MSQQLGGKKTSQGKSSLPHSNANSIDLGKAKGYKTNPNILDSHQDDDNMVAQINQKNSHDPQFMGKRNQVLHQQTAPNQTAKRGKASTINVEDL